MTAETSNARGLVVAWQYRRLDPEDGIGPWIGCSESAAEIIQRNPLFEVRPLYATPPPPADAEVRVYQCPRCATSMEVDPTAKPEARGVVDEDALLDARTIYDIACIREAKDNATREDVQFKAICLRNYNLIAALTEARNVR